MKKTGTFLIWAGIVFALLPLGIAFLGFFLAFIFRCEGTDMLDACHVLGVDVGPALSTMMFLHWFVLVTFLPGILVALVGTGLRTVALRREPPATEAVPEPVPTSLLYRSGTWLLRAASVLLVAPLVLGAVTWLLYAAGLDGAFTSFFATSAVTLIFGGLQLAACAAGLGVLLRTLAVRRARTPR